MTNANLLSADTAQQWKKPPFFWHQLKRFLGDTIHVDNTALSFIRATNILGLVGWFFKLGFVSMRNGHALASQTARATMTKEEEHLHCQRPYVSRDELAKN